MNIGKNIYDLRKSKGFTQSKLAEKLGVSEQAISKWENDISAPDVSMLPLIARLFGVSIDRVFGFHLTDNDDEVSRLLEEADKSGNTQKEIEILSEGLKRFPNSDRLKTALAFSYSILYRIAKNDDEKSVAMQRAISLCNEVISSCGDEKQIDSALITLSRIYTEKGDFDAAYTAIQKMSADNYYGRIAYTASLLANKHDISGQLTYVEEALYHCWLAMCQTVEGLENGLLHDKKDAQRALEFQRLHLRLLSLFDEGLNDELKMKGQTFYATTKMFSYEKGAEINMALGDKNGCLDDLERFFGMASAVRAVASSDDFHLSHRNSYFAEASSEDMQEEYMSKVFPERVLKKYEAFLGNEPRFERLVPN